MMIRSTLAIAAGALLCAICSPARAGLPLYPASGLDLKCRANFSGAFNLPNSTFFTNGTPSLNSKSQVAIKLEVIGGSGAQGVWCSAVGPSGDIVYTSPVDGVLSDVSLNTGGFIAVEQFFTSPTAIILVDTGAGTNSIGVAPGGFFGLTQLGTPVLSDAGAIGFRGFQAIGGQAFISDLMGSQIRHASEVGANPASPYSFLFTPNMNNSRQIVGKARRGALNQTGESQPDEIRIWNPDGTSVVIAQDADANAGSPFARFDNSVGINDNGQVAFIATLVGGGRGVFLGDENGFIEIASTVAVGALRVNSVEFFRPDVNIRGFVAFRALDSAGVQSVLVGDGVNLRHVAGRGDQVQTDLGLGMIAQNDTSPVFGGGPTINDRGDVAFNCALTPAGNNQIEWGSGVYIAHAARAADLDGDGAVSASDLAILLGSWGDCPAPPAECPADLNGDGTVGAADLAVLLGSWG